MTIKRPGRVALRWLVPLMVASAICTQEEWSPTLSAIGQITSTAAVLLSGYVILVPFWRSWWAPLVIATIFVLKALRVVFPANERLVLAYQVADGLLFCAAGAIAAVRCPRVIGRQVTLICILGVPLMILQLLGVGVWTQVMRTDWHDEGIGETTQYPTFLRTADEVTVNTVQSRPAGFFSSNNLLSMVLMWGIGLHFAQADRRRLGWRDVGMGLAIVLVVVSLWLFLVGGRRKRRYVLKMAAVVAGLVALYARLFPGMFAYNASSDAAVLNFQIRWYDLMFSTGIQRLVDYARAGMAELSKQKDLDDPTQRQSGYSMLGPAVGYMLAAIAVVAPFFWHGLRWLGRVSQARLASISVMMLILAMVPMISSFLSSVFFWFMAGFALLPLFLAFEPRFRRLVRRQVQGDFPASLSQAGQLP
jgi:hypothetical protein